MNRKFLKIVQHKRSEIWYNIRQRTFERYEYF